MVIERENLDSLSSSLENNAVLGNKGFTLVELLVVAAILGILSAMSLGGYTVFREQARVARCIGEINGLEKDISAYAVDKGSYPAEATWLADIGRSSLLDPWGNPYIYKPFTPLQMRHDIGDLNTDYDLYSKGLDGDSVINIDAPLSPDDIIRAGDGGYIGLASKF